MSLTNTAENQILDAMLGASATLYGSSIQIALSTTDPGEDGTGITEPVGNNYSRLTVLNNGTNFSAASGGVKTNASDFTFAQATGGSWGSITHWGIFDGGALKLSGILDNGSGVASPITVSDGDILRFLVGNLRITLD